MATRTASCLCGACKITISKIISTGICHCMTCRKMTSSVFSLNAAIPSDDFVLTKGDPKSCALPTENKFESKQSFCRDCGTTLWVESPEMPGIKVLKAGTLDGEDALSSKDLWPKAEQFTIRRPAWLCPVAGAVQAERLQKGVKEAIVMKLEKLKW